MLQIELDAEALAEAMTALHPEDLETYGDEITGRLTDDDLDGWLRGVYGGLGDDELDRAKSLLQAEIDARHEFTKVDDDDADDTGTLIPA